MDLNVGWSSFLRTMIVSHSLTLFALLSLGLVVFRIRAVQANESRWTTAENARAHTAHGHRTVTKKL